MTTRHSHTIHKPVKVLPSTSQLWPSHTKPDNYFVKWTGGDLGLALTSEPVCVSRVTGKGCPQRHLELVRPGDVLLSVNGLPTKHLGMDVVLRILRHCRLPATLHFGRPGFDDFWTYPHRSSMPSFPPSSLGLETPRPRRMSFTPPSCYVDDITSPRNSKGPVKSPLVSNPQLRSASVPSMVAATRLLSELLCAIHSIVFNAIQMSKSRSTAAC